MSVEAQFCFKFVELVNISLDCLHIALADLFRMRGTVIIDILTMYLLSSSCKYNTCRLN